MSNETKKSWHSILEDKNKFIWLAAALFLGVGLMLIGSLSKNSEESLQVEMSPPEQGTMVDTSLSAIAKAEKSLEQRLEQILGKIEGAGDVAVTVFLKESPEYEYAVNVSTTEKKIDETDGGGGTRITTEYNEDGNIVLVRSGTSGENPIIVKEIKPEIQGVLVVAAGAKDPLVKEKITRALKTLLNISPTKISVLEGR